MVQYAFIELINGRVADFFINRIPSCKILKDLSLEGQRLCIIKMMLIMKDSDPKLRPTNQRSKIIYPLLEGCVRVLSGSL